MLFPPEVDEVHVSVAFTWDLPRAEYLARQWARVAPVKIGGPAFNQPGGEFVPGRYLKEGYTITSRGCPNNCWFCAVPKREKGLRELPIKDGWNLLDDNILACSEPHIRAVFDMLRRQPQEIEFTGGLEAARLEPWHVDLLASIRLGQAFFAYDTPDDWEPLWTAAQMLRHHGMIREGGRHRIRCYVLIGWPQDTMSEAEARLERVLSLGIYPMAMLYRDHEGKTSPEWRKFQRSWARPQIIGAKMAKAVR
jgi:hypothetical protein